MKKILFLSIISLLFSIASCKKDSNNDTEDSNLASADAYLISKILAINNAEGRVSIGAHDYYHGIDNLQYPNQSTHSYEASAGFKSGQIYDSVGIDNIIIKPKVFLNGQSNSYYPAQPIKPEEYIKLFGKKVKVTLYNNNTSTNSNIQLQTRGSWPSFSGFINTPLQINATIPVPYTPPATPTPNPKPTPIPRNVPLNWTPDPNNDKVYIAIWFNPNDIYNAHKYPGYTKFGRYYSVPDNGSTTIPEAKLNGIPDGAHFEIVLGRGTSGIIGGTSDGHGGTALISLATSTISGGGGCNGTCIYAQ